MILRSVICTMCKKQEQEKSEGDGWPGWIQIIGIDHNGDANPFICSNCAPIIFGALDKED